MCACVILKFQNNRLILIPSHLTCILLKEIIDRWWWPWLSRWCNDEESACQCRRCRLIPGLERSPEAGNGNPLQYSCLRNSLDRVAWQATYSLWSRKELDVTEHAHMVMTLGRQLGKRWGFFFLNFCRVINVFWCWKIEHAQ